MHFLVGNNGATEALTILNSGNVGIGTTAPAALLTVGANKFKVDSGGSVVIPLQTASLSFGGSDPLIYGQTSTLSLRANVIELQGNGAAQTAILRWYNNKFDISSPSAGNLYLSGNVGIGTTAPDQRLHAELDDATTNAVTQLARLTHTTSGVPAAGLGTGLEFEAETAAANNEVGAPIEGVPTDVPAASEDFDLVIKTMTAGAAATEKLRVDSTGLTTLGAAGTDGTLKFYNELGATDYAVTLTPCASQSASYTLTLPTALPGSTQFLQTTSAGVLAWPPATTAPAGADTQVQFNDGGAFGADAGLVYNKTTDALTVVGTTAVS